MKKINEEFSIPYYLFEEITEYIELNTKGSTKSMKWENIKSLLKFAVANKRLTKEQADFIEKQFNRE